MQGCHKSSFVKMHYLQTIIKPGMSVCQGFPLKYSSKKGKKKHMGQAKMKLHGAVLTGIGCMRAHWTIFFTFVCVWKFP